MTKLHFDDLTQITCPFGMLDDDTQERLDEHKRDMGDIEIFNNDGWFNIGATGFGFQPYGTYRAKPKPIRVVTWLVADLLGGWCFYPTLPRAMDGQEFYGGYIYKVERDEDGSNPTIELVVAGGKDE